MSYYYEIKKLRELQKSLAECNEIVADQLGAITIASKMAGVRSSGLSDITYKIKNMQSVTKKVAFVNSVEGIITYDNATLRDIHLMLPRNTIISKMQKSSIWDKVQTAVDLQFMRSITCDAVSVVDKLSAIQEQIWGENSSFVTDLNKNIPNFAGMFGEALANVDIDALSEATDEVLSTTSYENCLNETTSSEEAIEENLESYAGPIAKKYEERKKEASKGEKAGKNFSISPEKVIDWLIALIQIVITLYGAQTINNISNNYYNIYNFNQTNNYYVIEQGEDASELNDNKWRIVKQDSEVRIKPDCSSFVVGYVLPGNIVQIITRPNGENACKVVKKRGWRMIKWQYNGKSYTGWIQNWKLGEFKNKELEI